MKNLILLSFLLGIFATSCKTASVGSFDKVKKMITTNTWILQDENGNVKGFNGQDVTMSFMQTTDFQASGFAGCNNYFSSVDLQADYIKFTQPGSTLMACPDTSSESAFLDLLPQINGYEISGNELKLYQDKILLLRFKAK